MDEYCVEFAIGRKYEANKGSCILFKDPCQKSEDATMDMYVTSPKVNPGKAAKVCTHVQAYSID
jgi:hypothetical protein